MSDVPPPPAPAAPPPAEPSEITPEMRRVVIGAVAGILLVLAVVGVAVYFMALNPVATSVIRDIFIIFMAFESLLIGVVLVILMVQLAKLTNLLQHEIKPILQNTNETVNTVRSTALFVSENLVDPVMKLNSYIAAIGKFFELINIVGNPGNKK